MKVGGIQPAQEVTVTLTLLKLLEVEAGAYCLRVPTAYFLRSGGDVNKGVTKEMAVPPQDAEYSFRVEINAQQRVTYVSVPSHAQVSKVSKEMAQPQAGHTESILIEKLNASTKDLKKDLVVFFRTVNMDRPQLLA